MKTVWRVFQRMSQMTDLAYYILIAGLLISCACLGASLLILILGGGLSIAGYWDYLMAKELLTLPLSVLLIAIIGSACLEDLQLGK